MIHQLTLFSVGKIFQLRREKVSNSEKKETGTVYNNCVFGQPFLVQSKMAANVKEADLDELVKFVAEKTGFNDEMVERVFETANEFFNTK